METAFMSQAAQNDLWQTVWKLLLVHLADADKYSEES